MHACSFAGQADWPKSQRSPRVERKNRELHERELDRLEQIAEKSYWRRRTPDEAA